MRLILFLCGKAGSGKSTLARRLGMMGWHTFHTSAVAKRFFSIEQMAEDEDPTAPASVEQDIRVALCKWIGELDKVRAPTLLVVDSMPRTQEQTFWLLQTMRAEFKNWSWHILFLKVEEEVQRLRLLTRDGMSSERAKLNRARLESDDENIANVFNVATGAGLPYSVCDTTQLEFNSKPMSLDALLLAVENLRSEKCAYKPSVRDERWYLKRILEELDEAFDAVTPEELQHELVDILVFLIRGFRVLGVETAEQLSATVAAKLGVVHTREETQTHKDRYPNCLGERNDS